MLMKINPYLSFKGNCKEAMEFYQAALGAKLVYSVTFGDSPMAAEAGAGVADLILHATVEVEGSILMMSDDPTPGAKASAGDVSLMIGLSDPKRAEELFAKLSVGGTVTMPLTKTFWAEKFGMVRDQFGVHWMLNCEAPR